jgi:hypothetical protein
MKGQLAFLGLIAALVTLWVCFHRFEFKITAEGRREVLYSCDKFTGECKEVT